MLIEAISDTHSYHPEIETQGGNILVHTGDLTISGSRKGIKSVIKWMAKQPHDHKIFIAGNHDFALEDRHKRKVVLDYARSKGVHYLENSGVEIEGIKFWGSPYTPKYGDYAFMKEGATILPIWEMIPEDTDVLLTHGPPFGILDNNMRGDKCGCKYLDSHIRLRLPNLKYHIFGHIHEGRGILETYKVTYINAAVCGIPYKDLRETTRFKYE